ncbi:cell division cycle protein 123 homolog [Lutzomyia longipalpis]|uniref:cell division cycle protein 123 homolog n=1 Tax=Lutzomyia longipalpis TaxID=7200 RepID=UPI0024845B7E|nr:cell division cycle protein 123 homolog [Lutzomyia longipalpis]
MDSPPKKQEMNILEACSFGNWYEKFEKITIKSFLLPIPNDILDYLRDDIIILPRECLPETEEEEEETIEEEEDSSTVSFPEFSGEIQRILQRLPGGAFLKTNWHCARDAHWIMPGQSLRVRNLDEVYQLLKASNFSKMDLSPERGFACGFNFTVVLRKWQEINPANEFRCFVRRHTLIAISPRAWPEYYEHIYQQKSDIIRDICTLFKEYIKNRFPLNDYVFDVVRERKDSVQLVDFAPFNQEYTNSLAFDWLELEDDEKYPANGEDEPEFCYLKENIGIQPKQKEIFGLPLEFTTFAGNSEASVAQHLTELGL